MNDERPVAPWRLSPQALAYEGRSIRGLQRRHALILATGTGTGKMFQLPDLLGIAGAGAVAGFAKTMVRRDGVRVVRTHLTIAS